MKVAIPPTTQVGGHKHEIVFTKDLIDEGLYGRVNHRTLRIELNPVRPESQQMEALLHEIIHVVSGVYCNNHLSEDDVSGVSEGLCQVMRQWGIEFDLSQIPEVGDNTGLP